jgi:hypothetical protein
MILWMSSESTSAIGDEFRIARNALEQTANQRLKGISAGEWRKWAVIFIMLPDKLRSHYPETRRLTRRDMTLDFRVAIDYEAAKRANFAEFIDLMVIALEKTLPYFKKARVSQEIQDEIRDSIRLAAEEIKSIASAKH